MSFGWIFGAMKPTDSSIMNNGSAPTDTLIFQSIGQKTIDLLASFPLLPLKF
jgi:hypothetical protein